MRHTASETSTQTLTRLVKALDANHPVTITYTKADNTETIRTIEIYEVRTTKAGDITLKAMDRDSLESRTFRLDRITAYTTHRTAYLVPRPAAAADGEPRPALPIASAPATIIGREIARDDAAYFNDRHAVLNAA